MANHRCFPGSARLFGAIGTFILAGGPAFSQAAPQIQNLSQRGLQTGAKTTIAIDGSDLLPAPRLLMSIPVASQTVKAGATASRVVMEVTLDSHVSPGFYLLRVANVKGVSNAVVVGVDDLPQLPFAAEVPKLPAALHGTLAGDATVSASFQGKKGQRIVAEVEARRLGAAIDPLLELHDPRGVQLSWSQGRAILSDDARLEAVLPADGRYSVVLRDALYKAGTPNQFRLKIGDLHYADFVFPLGVQRGTRTVLQLLGHLPKDTRVPFEAHTALAEVRAPLPPLPALTGQGPPLVVSDYPEVVETAAAKGELQEVTAPVAINGRIAKPGEEDRYRLMVTPGTRLRIEVFANRARSPLDGVLAVRTEAGAPLAGNDDQADTVDPGLDFTVPEGVHAVVVALTDLHGHGGPDFVYRLSIVPRDRPDFRLTVFEDRVLVAREGSAVIRVRANRAGYDGPIKLSLPGLPPGVVLAGADIAAGQTDTLLSLTAPADLPLAQLLTHLVGETTEARVKVRRQALALPTAPTRDQPGMRGDLGLAITAAEAVHIAWDFPDGTLPVGATFPAKVTVTRAAGASGPVRLAVLTSQIVPRTMDGKQDDLTRTIRVDGKPMIAADRTAGAVPVVVPGDLPMLAYDLAVRAELLRADGQTVVATAHTPSRRFRAVSPLTLQLTGPAAVEAKGGLGTTGRLQGKVVRAAGFNQPVTVTLTGLPGGLSSPAVQVPADRSDFVLPVAFPFGTKPGALPNVQLVAKSTVAPKQELRSNSIAVGVTVVPGEPPPAPAALVKVFEDEPAFVGLLTEGDGKASLETADRYSGTASLRVTPVQRFRAAVPGWAYRIKEKPGSGEYRYLTFAWKKRGGDNVMIQLNANGKWGPVRGVPGPAFRYEAGKGDNPYKIAAVKVSDQLPVEWVAVTRDLFADFGEFTLTGIAFTAGPGEFGLFDHIYLAATREDLKQAPPQVVKKP